MVGIRLLLIVIIHYAESYKDVKISGKNFISKGQTIFLTCNATGDDYAPNGVDWFINGQIANHRTMPRVRIYNYADNSKRTLHSTLEIRRSKMSDNGIYVCRATRMTSIIIHILDVHALGNVTEEPPPLTTPQEAATAKKSSRIRDVKITGKNVISKGQTIFLTCNATGDDYAPDGVDWFINGHIANHRTMPRVRIYNDADNSKRTLHSTLEIRRSKMSDKGIYVCRVPDALATRMTSITIHILDVHALGNVNEEPPPLTTPQEPVDGNLSDWSEWRRCTVTCGGGNQTRTRLCGNPSSFYRGKNCTGGSDERRECGTTPCPESPVTGVISAVVVVVLVLVDVIVVVIVIVIRELRSDSDMYEVRHVNRGEEQYYAQVVTHEENSDIYDEPDIPWLTDHRTPFDAMSDYDETRYDAFVNTAIMKKDGIKVNSVLTKTPNEYTIDVFWKMVTDLKIGVIIWLSQTGEQVIDMCPTMDNDIDLPGFTIKLIGLERRDNAISLFSIEVMDTEKKTVQPIKVYKTIGWEISERWPDITTMSDLITTPQMLRGVILMGSKGIGFQTCAVLGVYLEVVQRVKEGQTFNILDIALRLNERHLEFFQTYEEYEVCYKVIQYFINNEHQYITVIN